MLIDTRAHINSDCYEDEVSAVIKRANDNGVGKIIVPAVEPIEFNKIIQLTNDYDNLYCALGVHPEEAKKYYPEVKEEIKQLIKNSQKIVAIGEIGLDYYW